MTDAYAVPLFGEPAPQVLALFDAGPAPEGPEPATAPACPACGSSRCQGCGGVAGELFAPASQPT